MAINVIVTPTFDSGLVATLKAMDDRKNFKYVVITDDVNPHNELLIRNFFGVKVKYVKESNMYPYSLEKTLKKHSNILMFTETISYTRCEILDLKRMRSLLDKHSNFTLIVDNSTSSIDPFSYGIEIVVSKNGTMMFKDPHITDESEEPQSDEVVQISNLTVRLIEDVKKFRHFPIYHPSHLGILRQDINDPCFPYFICNVNVEKVYIILRLLELDDMVEIVRRNDKNMLRFTIDITHVFEVVSSKLRKFADIVSRVKDNYFLTCITCKINKMLQKKCHVTCYSV